MRHDMRRFRQQLPDTEAKEILRRATSGVLSLVDTDGQPYGVPLSHVFDGDRTLYFHSARTGHKIDCISAGHRCSFCVIAQDDVIPEEFTTYFCSVICFGSISVVTDCVELEAALRLLAEKYSPGIDSTAEISRFINAVAVLRLDIDRMTGKESIELIRNRR